MCAGLILHACSAPGTPRRSASPPSPAPTTTGPAIGSRGLDGTDRLERRSRLVQVLPRSTPHYRIDFSVGADGRPAVQVVVLAVLNDARDLAGYRDELRRRAAEARVFIESHGDDPASYTVSYVPPEAAP